MAAVQALGGFGVCIQAQCHQPKGWVGWLENRQYQHGCQLCLMTACVMCDSPVVVNVIDTVGPDGSDEFNCPDTTLRGSDSTQKHDLRLRHLQNEFIVYT